MFWLQLLSCRYAAGHVLLHVASMLPKLFAVSHTMLTRQSAETLNAILSNTSARLTAEKVSNLLSIVCSADSAWRLRDTDVQLSLLKLVETGYMRCGLPLPLTQVLYTHQFVHCWVLQKFGWPA